MLDQIHYDRQPDGTYAKTVTHVETVTDVNAELPALQAQLAAFESDPEATTNPVLVAAIGNYREGIALLEADPSYVAPVAPEAPVEPSEPAQPEAN